MFTNALRLLIAMAVFLPGLAEAEPIALKLAYFSSDRSILYLAGIKPFVDAVNKDAAGLVRIDVYFSNALGPVDAEPRLVLDGKADIAFMIPGYTPQVFPDNAVVELPGLFRSAEEATLVYARLAAQGALKSYEPFVVLGTFASEPQSSHSRKPIAGLKDLKGLRVRANNDAEAAALGALGAKPSLLAINRTTEAIAQGALDAAMLPPAVLFEFGVGRVATHHYLLRASSALMLLAMNRRSFETLPVAAQAIIRKYSGAWAEAQYIAKIEEANAANLAQIRADPRRTLVVPSPQDSTAAQSVFAAIRKEWAARDAGNAALLAQVEAQVAKLRAEHPDNKAQ